jgi:hypothetical protein
MIRGICKTNLDNYDCSKVKIFVSLPRIGDRVAVTYTGTPVESRVLRVVDITHDVDAFNNPFIIVELHTK